MEGHQSTRLQQLRIHISSRWAGSGSAAPWRSHKEPRDQRGTSGLRAAPGSLLSRSFPVWPQSFASFHVIHILLSSFIFFLLFPAYWYIWKKKSISLLLDYHMQKKSQIKNPTLTSNPSNTPSTSNSHCLATLRCLIFSKTLGPIAPFLRLNISD